MWIQKYRLTCGFLCASVSLVPESACQPGLRDRVCRTKIARATGQRREAENGLRPRGGSGSGRSEKLAPKHRVAGQPETAGGGALWTKDEEAPQLRPRPRKGGAKRWHGLPG